MSNEANREYLKTMRDAYKKSDRKDKSLMLRHSMAVTGLSRKRLIRLFNGGDTIAPIRRAGRKAYYSDDVLRHIKRIWLLASHLEPFLNSQKRGSLNEPH